MSKEALIIAILVALMILWITETLGMRKTSRILSGAIDLGFAALRQQINKNKTAWTSVRAVYFLFYFVLYFYTLYISGVYGDCADVRSVCIFIVEFV